MVKLIPYVTVDIMGGISSFLHDKWGPATSILHNNEELPSLILYFSDDVIEE